MALAYLGMGSNIGDRKKNFREALRRLDATGKIEVKKSSSFYLTRPVGGPKQPDYLNGVISVETELDPHGLLKTLKDIEKAMGRRKAPKNHPRLIDIDILFYDHLVMKSPGLVIPHPRAHERAFVLKGLVQIAPGLKDPVTGEKIKNITKEPGIMKMITAIDEMKKYSRKISKDGKSIGFVPTMGYLHEGHMSLVRKARKECDAVVVSIFVNPAQFGPGEDLKKYPRDMKRDSGMLKKEGVDVIFFPSAEEMYPSGFSAYVEVSGALTKTMCGASRPGHFKGVATVVAKLFNIVRPDIGYFGQKDAQQAAVIKRMTRDLDMPVKIKVMPTVREDGGLARSSRNKYLSNEERCQALLINKALKKAELDVKNGSVSAKKLKKEIERVLRGGRDIKVDYVAIVDADTFLPVDRVKGGTLIAVAAYVGKTRLIDNVQILRTEKK